MGVLASNDRNISPAEWDPPITVPGMVRISLDPEGRLRTFLALPKATGKGRGEPFDWTPLFHGDVQARGAGGVADGELPPADGVEKDDFPANSTSP